MDRRGPVVFVSLCMRGEERERRGVGWDPKSEPPRRCLATNNCLAGVSPRKGPDAGERAGAGRSARLLHVGQSSRNKRNEARRKSDEAVGTVHFGIWYEEKFLCSAYDADNTS